MYTSVIRPLQFLGGILQVQRGAVRERQKGTGAVGGARVRGRVGQVWGVFCFFFVGQIFSNVRLLDPT